MASGLATITLALLTGIVQADRGNRGGGRWAGGYGGRNGDDNEENFPSEENGFGFGSIQSFDRANAILITHAVLASAVWVLFVPWAALLLRLNIKSPIVLKSHAFFQVLSLAIFIVAAGMGIWLARQMSDFGVWEDAHPRLGLAILAIAILQPIFGIVHHRVFKKRSAAATAGTATKAPGRTVPGHIHLWVGRSLIVLGIINGGLGIRLTSFSPFRTDSQTRTAGIVYGVIAGVMFALYATLVILFETRRKRATNVTPYPVTKGHLPSYEESQSSATSLASRQNTGGQNQGNANNAANNTVRYSSESWPSGVLETTFPAIVVSVITVEVAAVVTGQYLSLAGAQLSATPQLDDHLTSPPTRAPGGRQAQSRATGGKMSTDDDLFLFNLAPTPNDFDAFLADEQEQETATNINPSDLIKKEPANTLNFPQNHRGSSSSSSDESQHHRTNSEVSLGSTAAGWNSGINGYSMPFNDSVMGGVDTDFDAKMASDFDFETAGSTPSGFDPQMSYGPALTPAAQSLKRTANMARFGQPKNASPKMANAQSGFYIANSREASPLNAMISGPSGHSPWNKHSPSAGLEETFNTITMEGDSPGNPAFSPNMPFNGNFTFDADSSATPSSFGMDVTSPPSSVPSAPDGAPRLTVHPTSLKSRVETQIPIILTMSSLPPGTKKLKLPTHTVSKPKFLIKGEYERSAETLDLYTSLVCTSAMQDKVKLQRALARARGEDLALYSKPSPASSTTSSSSRDDEDKPLNGGEVKICTGCIQRERKRASRKKQKKPEEEEAFQRDEEKRVVVFNTGQIREWAEPQRDSPEGSVKTASRGSSAPPGAMQVELPMRIACYCRHQNEKLGFQVIFTIKDHLDRVIAQSLTNPIMITDDHKTHNAPAAAQPAPAPVPNAPTLPGAGVFQTSAQERKASATPKMFKQSFSTNDLNGLQNNFNPTFPMATSSNPFAISSGTLTPRNLSRPASPNASAGPSTKRRKQSGSGKLPSGLTMTRLDTMPTQPGISTMPNTAASSPYATNMTSYMMPPTGPYVNPVRPPGSGTSPPTPNGTDPTFAAINRSFSLENMPRQAMISAPPSRQPSRPGSPISGRNSFGAADQNLAQGVSNQLMNQTSRRSPPLIHKLVPAEGSVTGGTEVTLLGNGFYQGLEVMFGDTEATTTTFWGEKCLNCIAPPALQPGTVAVVFKHEHRNYMQQAGQTKPILFTYTDDRELEMFRLALRTIGKQMSLPTDDPYSAAQQLLQGSHQSMWGGPSGGYMGHQRSSGMSGPPMDMLELENTMVQLLDYIDLRAPAALTRLDMRRPTGLTLLHLASSLGLTRFAAGLLARGANPHLVDSNGHTSMHHAAMSGHTHIIHRLRLSGASHKVRSVKNFTPADMATSLLAYQAVTVPSAHYRSRSVGGTPIKLHSRRASSASLHSFWEQGSSYIDTDSDESADNMDMPHDLMRTGTRSRPVSRRGSTQHGLGALQPLTASPATETNDTFMAAWRDQLQHSIHRYNETTQAIQSMMPSFPALNGHLQALQQEYQGSSMVRRVSQLFPQRPSTSRSNSRRNDGWWDTLTGNRSPSPTQEPPAYESLFPKDGPSPEDLSLKKLSEEQAAADVIADRHFGSQSSSSGHTHGQQGGDIQELLLRRDIQRVELSKDRKLFFIWIPILAIMLGLMLHSSGVFELFRNVDTERVIDHVGRARDRVVEVM